MKLISDDVENLEDLPSAGPDEIIEPEVEPWPKRLFEMLSFLWFGKKEYIITPMILLLNLAIFIILIISGNFVLMPFSERLLDWGYMHRPLTLRIEEWRLLVSFFVHSDVISLLINMSAFTCIGYILEPIAGKLRFITAYILSGIIGSIASFVWQEMAISIGASGAICGLYGFFFALYTTGILKKEKWMMPLIVFAVFLIYHIINVTYRELDHSAHIGGLIAGLFIGYAYSPSFKSPNNDRVLAGITTAIVIVFLSSTLFIYYNSSNDAEAYSKNIKDFLYYDSQAINIIFQNKNPDIPPAFIEQGIPMWREAIKYVNRNDELNLIQPLRKRNLLLHRYCELRIETYKIYERMYEIRDSSLNAEIRTVERDLSQVMEELSGKPNQSE